VRSLDGGRGLLRRRRFHGVGDVFHASTACAAPFLQYVCAVGGGFRCEGAGAGVCVWTGATPIVAYAAGWRAACVAEGLNRLDNAALGANVCLDGVE
jgi:hypothetical protein